jgi:hypothetical protein
VLALLLRLALFLRLARHCSTPVARVGQKMY